MPKNFIYSGFAASLISVYLIYAGYVKKMKELTILFVIVTLVMLLASCWSVLLYRAFSYDGKRQMSKQIIEGNAVELPYEDERFDAIVINYVYHNIRWR